MNKIKTLIISIATITFSFQAEAKENNLAAETRWFTDENRPWLLTVSHMKETPGIGIAEFKTKEECDRSAIILGLVGDSAAELRESKRKDLAGTCWKKGDSRRGHSWYITDF